MIHLQICNSNNTNLQLAEAFDKPLSMDQKASAQI